MNFCDSFPPKTRDLGMFFGPNSCTRKGHTLRFNVHYFTWWCILNQENMGGTNFGVRDRTNSFDGSRFMNLYLTVDLHYTRFPNALNPMAKSSHV
jgi:hypothetical protein